MYIYQAGQRTHVGGADPAPGSPVCNLHHLGCGSCTWEDHREKGQTLNKAKGGSDLSLRPALCGPGQVNGPLRASGPFTSGAVTGRRDKTQEALHESTQHAVLRLAARLCLTLCNPMDCSPPGSSVHGVLQAGILEGAAIHCLVTNYSPSAIILLLSSGFCGPGIRERSSGSISGSRCRDCTRTRACVKHPLWTLAKPRLRLTWAGVSESWPGLF